MGHYDSFYEERANEEFEEKKRKATERLKKLENLSENFDKAKLLMIKEDWAYIDTNSISFNPEKLHKIVGFLIVSLESAHQKIEQLEKLKQSKNK